MSRSSAGHFVSLAKTMQRRAAELSEEQPIADEIAAIEAVGDPFRHGKLIPLEQLRHELRAPRPRTSAKKSRSRSRR
jgi:hypothetical protein